MDAPRLTPSMQIALADLALDQIAVVYPGTNRYPLAERVNVVPLQDVVLGGPEAVFPPRE
jgi:hypothetical protein